MTPAQRMPVSSWSDWQPLPSAVSRWDAAVLAETLDGGQAFRWHPQPAGSWLGVWAGCVMEIRLQGDSAQWRAPTKLATTAAKEIGRYFAAEVDYTAVADTLPWRSDPHLARCLSAFPGLRLLRQPFGETLLGFLCSATKQIVQIKQMLALLAERHGAVLVERVDLNALNEASPKPGPRLPAKAFHRLPTWPELAQLSEADLRGCLLGFRARYIHQTASFLAAHPGWLEETESLPYPEAKARLCSLPGVGEKIADCVLLFGAGRLEAFPVDVWILKTMAARYELQGWKPAQVAQFGRVHFGPLAGLAQQYLFAYERRAAQTKVP